jgi:hypothetical protein
VPLPPLPPEIWQTIFDITRSGSVPNIRLTCKLFALLCRPMAFRCFSFCPFVVGKRNTQRFSPPQDVVAWRMKRLDFWASDEIACHVREICLVPRRSNEISIGADSDRLLNAFFHVLPKFITVQTLNCQAIPFDDFALRQVCRLDSLQTLDINRTSIITNSTPARADLRLNSLKYSTGNTHDTLKDRDKTNIEWLLVTHPNHIQEVCLQIWYPSVAEHFLSFLTTTQTIQHVTEILIPHSDALIRLLVSALSCVDSNTLKILEFARSLDTHNEPLSNLGSVLVPSLHTYVGPHQFLLSFVPGNAIRFLRLSGLGRSLFSDPVSLLYTMRRLPLDSSANVASLFIGVTRLTNDVLEVICSRCINLKLLSVMVNLSLGDVALDLAGADKLLEVGVVFFLTFERMNAYLGVFILGLFEDSLHPSPASTARANTSILWEISCYWGGGHCSYPGQVVRYQGPPSPGAPCIETGRDQHLWLQIQLVIASKETRMRRIEKDSPANLYWW